MRALKLFILFFIVLFGCKTEEKLLVKENPPTVLTKAATDVSFQNATLNGEVTDEGFSATSDRGFVFSDKNTNPSVSDTKVQSGYGKGVYSIVLDKLPVNTKYHYKAYATNTKGTSYGEVQSFTTADYKLPTAVTDVPKNITFTTVELGGSVTDEGGGAVSESGFVVGINVSPTITDLKFPVTKGKTAIALVVSKLNVNTKYFVRSYAVNEKGVAYGNEQNFTTLDFKLPTVLTGIPKDLTYFSVEMGGSITDDGGVSITEGGICYGINSNPTILDNKVSSGIGLVSFKIFVENLKNNTKYFFRAFAINKKGIAYGNEQIFTTLNVPITPERDNKIIISEVKSKTGRIWMDRNLGSSQVALSSNDEKSFGDLYQWGRGADGHQIRTSNITSYPSSKDQKGNDNFISVSAFEPPRDWRIPKNDNLWQGINGVNNPCPSGFRLPTKEEWIAEKSIWSSDNGTGAFESILKLPLPGSRNSNGDISGEGIAGYYWSSSITEFKSADASAYLILFGKWNYTSIGGDFRGQGHSVRCIKD